MKLPALALLVLRFLPRGLLAFWLCSITIGCSDGRAPNRQTVEFATGLKVNDSVFHQGRWWKVIRISDNYRTETWGGCKGGGPLASTTPSYSATYRYCEITLDEPDSP